LILLAEILKAVASFMLILSSGFYLRHLEKTKKKRKLSGPEFAMYLFVQIAFAFFAIGLLIGVFFR